MKNHTSIKLIFLLLLINQLITAQASHSDIGSIYQQSVLGKNVYVFEPSMNMKEVQTVLDTIYNRQSGKKSEFTNKRVALFFMPGTYHLDVKVGYYMQVYGLGSSPDEVEIIGAVRSKSTSKSGNVLSNFWRSAENLTIVPTIDSANIWGVSQAAPLRRIHVKGNLQLHDGGYASGGFMADCQIDGTVFSGQQQQWFSRNTDWGKWTGGAWNMMFMGVPHAPEGTWPKKPYTVIKETPLVREKPYLVYDQKGYFIQIPAIDKNSIGPGWGNKSTPVKSVSINEFYVAFPE